MSHGTYRRGRFCKYIHTICCLHIDTVMTSSGELPRGLVSDHSSLLAFSSNCSLESSRPKCDEDAEKIASILTSKGGIKSSSIQTTASEQCTKKGLQDAIGDQVSNIPVTLAGDGLFIFVYCGGACDLQSLDSSAQIAAEDEDGFVNVEFTNMQCTHSLILKDFNPSKAETYVSGETIANAITTSPKQLLVILDCPYAEEIGEDIRRHLQPCELTLIASQGKGVASHYLSPLESSTFSHFFCSFLAENCTDGVVKTRSLHSKVAACCDALSSLRMVRDGQFLKAGKAVPKGRFEQIIKSANAEMKRIEEKDDDDDDDSEEQVDYEGTINVCQFLKLYYKKYWFDFRPVTLCKEAKDWVHGVIEGPLLVLKEHGRLEGKVLEAVIGSMMASIVTKQCQFPEPNKDAKSSNIFLQAYVYVIAAIDILDPKLKLFDISLLKCAQEFYSGTLRANNIVDDEIQELKWTKIERV